MSLAEQRVEKLYNQLPSFCREPKIVSYKNQYRLYLSEEEMGQDIGFQNHLHSFCSSRTFEAVKEDIDTKYKYHVNSFYNSKRPGWMRRKDQQHLHLWADAWANQLHYTGSVLGEENPEVFEKIAYKAFLNVKKVLATRFPTQAFNLYLKLNYATDDETIDFGYEQTPCFDLWFEKYYSPQEISQWAIEDYDFRLEYSQEVMRRRLEQKKAGKAVEYEEPIWIRNFVNFTDSDSFIASIPAKYVANAYFLYSEADTPKIVSINTGNSKTFESADKTCEDEAKFLPSPKHEFEDKKHDNYIELTEKVKDLFYKSGMDKHRLAKKAGIAASTISKWLSNKREIYLKTFLKICEGLGTRVKLDDKSGNEKQDSYLELARKVKDLFQKSGMSQKELAKKVGISPCTISSWLSTERDVYIKTFANICQSLGVRIEIEDVSFVDIKQELDAKDYNYLELARKVKDVFYKSGMSRAELAKRAGVSELDVSQYLFAKRDIYLKTLTNICQSLGVRIEIEGKLLGDIKQEFDSGSNDKTRDNYFELIQKVKDLFKESGMSRAELARKGEVPQLTTLSGWLNGKKDMYLKTFIKVCESLQAEARVEVDDVLFADIRQELATKSDNRQESSYHKLNNKLKDLFYKSSLNTEELADKAGVSAAGIYLWLSDKTGLFLKNFIKICEALGARIELDCSFITDIKYEFDTEPENFEQDTYLRLTKKVRLLCDLSDMNQTQLAKKAKIADSTISNWMHNKKEYMLLYYFIKICEALGARVKIKV